MRKAERIRLAPGDVLELTQQDANGHPYIQKAVVEKYLGEGSSSLVYQVKLQMAGESRYLTMVMKEFYPRSTRGEVFVIKREEGRLKIRKETAGLEEFKQRRAQFWDGYERQNELSNSEAMEIMVKPFAMASCGDSSYLLSDVHMGKALVPEQFVTMEEKLHVIVRVAEMIQILHEQGYIFLDFKPENMLWIDRPKGVKLLDFDSLVNFRNLDSVHAEDIRYDTKYGAPEVRMLFQYDSMSFEQKKSMYLKPKADIYCIGQLMFRMIFGHMPSAGELSFEDPVKQEFRRLCRKAGCSNEDASEKLWQICRGCLQKRSLFRCPTAEKVAEDVNEVIRMLGSEPYILKKQVQTANHTIAACNLLEKYPVYRYAVQVDGCRNLDISITGGHGMIRQMIRSIIPCVQMLDSRIILRLFGRDCRDLLKELLEKYPAMSKTVTVFQHKKPVFGQERLYFEQEKVILDNVDFTMVEEPLVEIHLYTGLTQEETVSVIHREQSSYILCMEKSGKEAREMARSLIDALEEKRKMFIGVLGADSGQLRELASGISDRFPVTLEPITLIKKSKEYDERFVRNEIGKRALAIHTFYYRGKDEQASPHEILNDYKTSDYNIYSSMRAALSITYKFGSIGLDIHSKDASEAFWHKVLEGSRESNELLDQLTALEHRSWAAYMIMDGWDAPEHVDEIRKYAFTGKNDFKDKKRKLHPCLKTGFPGLGLKNFSQADWDNPDSPKWESLDPLDHMSVVLHQIAGEKAQKAREQISRKMEEMDILPEEMEVEQKIIREYESYHDYKHSDQDIVEAIPRILAMYDQGKKVGRTLIKPVYGGDECLENMLGALYLEPDRLLLIPMDEKNPESGPDEAYYRKFLEKRGLSTRVEIRKRKSIRRYSGKTYLDLTAVSDPSCRRKLREMPCLDRACGFEIREQKICPLDDPSVLIYNRTVHLSVEEMCFLKGFSLEKEDMSDGDKAAAKDRTFSGAVKNWAPERIFRYQSIWSAYRKVSAREWSGLIGFLSQVKEQNQYVFSLDRKACAGYRTEPVPYPLLEISGMDRILKICKREGLLERVMLPGKEDELPIEFDTVYTELASCLLERVRQMRREPFRHHFILRKNVESQEGAWLLEDDTLYADTLVRGKSQIHLLQKLLPLFAGQNDSEYTWKPFQSLVMEEQEDGLFLSFKYVSRAVREIFEKESSLLERFVYFRCVNSGLFDDVQIVPGYVVCIRNLETFLISLQFCSYTKKGLAEIMEYARHLKAGQMVLVNPDYDTSEELKKQVESLGMEKYTEIELLRCAGRRELSAADFLI